MVSQIFKDMLLACILHLGHSWEDHKFLTLYIYELLLTM